MRRKITIVGALLLCAILLTSASYFIRIERDCFYAHGWPISMNNEIKTGVTYEGMAPFISDDQREIYCGRVTYEMIIMPTWNAIIADVLFWFVILGLIYLPAVFIRRRLKSHNGNQSDTQSPSV